ncbi:MAG: hypothetical protein A2W90_15750 [Bacteroidetes bacterium GWF2_42_66]|nr:MAG: hypothetical protein A2W92_08280 [Bacteroidetes bacterium GWA2_42_15]OFY02711.1 MAG: hypothetical protein A2W89_04335 [Bacteroidetes bacterium GWE2_42_39]OFY43910.1 MAG: hypothetical protein A2W90_15750 [Bacteroidetes bacterium GWF2_42_66]HBL77566.1 hypothetical protein [Prolixibacteraceae bacterium]HCR90659.1 hypothetical protein [Prolixibacteraceae bacterium]
MIEKLNSNKTFTQIDFGKIPVAGIEFDDCEFINCNFSNSKLNDTDFLNCRFVNCNFMMAKTVNTGLKDVTFKGCKLMGFDFSICNDFLFQVEFEHCQLDYALFSKKKMKKTRFANCSIKEADFSETNLSEAKFDNSDLSGSLFQHCNLEKTDFRTAINFTIDPENNRMKGARFSAYSLAGLLSKYGLNIE